MQAERQGTVVSPGCAPATEPDLPLLLVINVVQAECQIQIRAPGWANDHAIQAGAVEQGLVFVSARKGGIHQPPPQIAPCQDLIADRVVCADHKAVLPMLKVVQQIFLILTGIGTEALCPSGQPAGVVVGLSGLHIQPGQPHQCHGCSGGGSGGHEWRLPIELRSVRVGGVA